MPEITELLSRIDSGDAGASSQLLPLVYNELKKLASKKLAGEKPGQTLQATDLVHEAYLRLVGTEDHARWNGRGHFFGAAAEAMRRILVDIARRKAAVKNGGGFERVELEELALQGQVSHEQLVSLDDALDRLDAVDAAAGHVFKLRFFSGLSLEEAAEVLAMSRSTAFDHWTFARAWLRTQV